MLANRLRTFTPITLLPRHNILRDKPVRVLEEFHHRLTTLYSAPNQACSQDTDIFLSRLSLPTLSEAHMALRNIQALEVLQCIKDLKVGKRPGRMAIRHFIIGS